MATKNTAIQNSNQEVIPSSEMPEFAQAVGKLATLETTLPALQDKATALKDKKWPDPAAFIEASAIITELKSVEELTDATMKPYDIIVDRVRNFIKTKKLVVKNRATMIRGIAEPWMTTYKRAELEATKKEQEEKQRLVDAENARKANEQRNADLKAATEIRDQKVADIRELLRTKKIGKREAQRQLEAAGAMEEAMKAKAAADAEDIKNNPPQVKVEANLPKAAGAGRQMTNFYAECTDKEAFLLDVIAEYTSLGKFGPMLKLIEVSDKKLSAEAREIKDNEKMQARYHGIRAWSEFTF